MKRLLGIFLLTVLVAFLIYACGNKNEYVASEDMMQVSMANTEMDMSPEIGSQQKHTIAFTPPNIKHFLTTHAADQDMNVLKRPLIKTAKLRFKVENVVTSSYAIEARALQSEGIILQSNINNQEVGSRYVRVSEDSSLFIRNYDIKGDLVIRVPQENLYKFLQGIADEAILIDYRLLNTKDLTVDLFSNSLEEKRMERKTKRMGAAISTRSGKLEEAIDAEETLDAAEQYADEVKVSEFRMQDDMKLSTIVIEIYQDRLEYKESVKYNEYVEEYETGIGSHLVDALLSGWNGLCSVFVFAVNLWPLVLLLIAGFMIYRRCKARKKS